MASVHSVSAEGLIHSMPNVTNALCFNIMFLLTVTVMHAQASLLA